MKLVGSKEAVRSPEFHKKRKREKAWRLALFTGALLTLISAPILALRDPLYQITAVDISGNAVTKTEDIHEIIAEALSGHYLWLVPKSNTLLYPKSAIAGELLRKIPRLSSANIALSGATGITVAVEERKPYALYCAERCYFLDDTGYIFSEAPSFSDGVYMVYKKEPELESPLGQEYLPREGFQKIDAFIRETSRMGLTPQSVGESLGEYTLSLKENPVLRWRADQDYTVLSANLRSFLLDPAVKSSLSTLDYIDLRFDNKIYYK